MSTAHSTVVLFHNTMQITDGHLADYRGAIEAAVDFTRKNAPQLMVEIFLDEEHMRAHSFQLYPDSDAILAHWELSDPYIQAVNRHCSVVSLEVYGEPDERVRDGLASAGAEIPVTFHPRLAGFTRALSTVETGAPG